MHWMMGRDYHNAAASEFVAPPDSLPDPRVIAFHRRLPGYAPTRLVSLPHIARNLGIGYVLVKDESSRLGLPAFKILGASWATFKAITRNLGLVLDDSTCIESLSEALAGVDVRLHAATDGNHGRAVARMAKLLGIPCVIHVPRGLDRATIEHISSDEGARVIEVQGDYDQAVQEAYRAANEQPGGILIQDTAFDGYEEVPKWIVDGYSTMLIEVDEQVSEVTGRAADVIIAPVGVGSLAQAVVAHATRGKGDSSGSTKVVTVEPDTAACLQKALLDPAAHPTHIPAAIQTSSTIMAGLNCGTVSSLAWPLLKPGVDVTVSVADIDTHRAVGELQSEGVHVGPCGAAPLAALHRLASHQIDGFLGPDSVVVLLATEGAREYLLPLDTTTEDPVTLTQILTRIDSSNPDLSKAGGAGEAAIAEYLFAWLAHHGFEVHRLERVSDRPSIVGVVRGSGGGQTLMFNGHIDTVSLAGYDGSPLSGDIINGAVHGRGAYDMKAGIAASLVAAHRAKETARLRGDIVLALVADEENLSIGTREVLDAGWTADAAVVSEFTDETLMLSHKGFVWADVDIIGKAGHGSRPDLCVDAIAKAGHFLVALERYGDALIKGEVAGAIRHADLGTGSVHVGLVKGGEELSSYPALCTVSIERRTVPGETPQLVEDQLRIILGDLTQSVPDFRYELRMGETRAPFEISRDHPFVGLVARHATDAADIQVRFSAATYWADSGLLAERGIPAILYGVKGKGAHASTEWVEVDSIRNLTDGLTRIAADFCQ